MTDRAERRELWDRYGWISAKDGALRFFGSAFHCYLKSRPGFGFHSWWEGGKRCHEIEFLFLQISWATK